MRGSSRSSRRTMRRERAGGDSEAERLASSLATRSARPPPSSTPGRPRPRTELLHVLMLPDFDRADAIGSYWGNPKTRAFGELLIERRVPHWDQRGG